MLKLRNLGLAAGIFWGALMFILTIISIFTGYASTWLEIKGSIYPAYSISWGGSIIGLLYGFINGFITMYIFGWIYNMLNKYFYSND